MEYISRIAVAMNYLFNADEIEIELNGFSSEGEELEINVDMKYCNDGGYVFSVAGYGDFVINGKEALVIEPEFIGEELAKIVLN